MIDPIYIAEPVRRISSKFFLIFNLREEFSIIRPDDVITECNVNIAIYM